MAERRPCAYDIDVVHWLALRWAFAAPAGSADRGLWLRVAAALAAEPRGAR